MREFTVTFTKNEQVLLTQILVEVVDGAFWDWPDSWHAGMGADQCEGCTALFKLGAPRTTEWADPYLPQS